MASVTFALPQDFKDEMKRLSWINWSELARLEAIKQLEREEKLNELRSRLESPEEQELTKWSVELGRKIKKERLEELKKRGLM